MTVFSSLQTLAKKYEEASRGTFPQRSPEEQKAYIFSLFSCELVDAWPLLEAAVKERDFLVTRMKMIANYHGSPESDIARAALFSLTGEPR